MVNREEVLKEAAVELQALLKKYNISIEILQDEHDSFMDLALTDNTDENTKPLSLDSGYKCVIFNQNSKL